MASIFITGANRGIGYELVRAMSKRGDNVIACCNHSSPDLESLAAKIYSGVDVTDDDSVTQMAESLKGHNIDVLINNAGILSNERLDSLDYDNIRRQFEVNSLGPLRVTSSLLENLKEGSKVIIITSRMGSIEDNTSGGYYGYRMSKAAVNMAAVSMANDLREKGVAVIVIHPGMVATDMTNGNGISPVEAARNIIKRIDGFTLDDSGSFWHANGEKLPW